MLRSALWAGGVLAISLWATSGAQTADALDVSLLQLIATPERYEGKRIRVQGFSHFEFEESALYLHREDADTMNSRNGVWLSTPRLTGKELSEAFVLVEGVFTAQGHGHLGLWPAEIRSITRLEVAGTRKDYGNIPPPQPPSPTPSTPPTRGR